MDRRMFVLKIPVMSQDDHVFLDTQELDCLVQRLRSDYGARFNCAMPKFDQIIANASTNILVE